jgi:hypothetical protein
VFGSVQRSLIFSDSLPIPKANTLPATSWFLKGLNCYETGKLMLVAGNLKLEIGYSTGDALLN